MKGLLALVAGFIGAVGVMGTAAPAQAYPPETPTATVSDTTVSDDGSVRFSGHALHAGETMTISVSYSSSGFTNYFSPRRLPRGVVGTTVADENGFWSKSVRLTQSGRATLTAVGNMGTPARSLQVLVLAKKGSSAGLAVTGPKVSTIVLTGVGAVLLGGLLVFGAVRWRRRSVGTDVA
jgi:hypothetical protein